MVSYQIVTASDALRLLDYTLYFDCSLSCVTYLGRPGGSVCRPQGGTTGRGSRRMFWELAPGDVIGKPAELRYANA